MTRLRAALLAAALAVAALALGASPAQAAPTCAQPGPGANGGDWPTFGRDDSNTRFQPHERVLSPGDAPLLSAAWTFSTADAGGEGDITGTPIVSGGCLYTATNRGWVFALNADTGELVWKAKIPYEGGINSSPGVAPRRCGKVVRKPHRRRQWKLCQTVFVGVSRTRKAQGCPAGDPCVGPYAVAYDARTGKQVWASRSLDDQEGSDSYGSPVVHDSVLMLGTSGGSAELGDEADRYAFQGSISFIDASNGKVMRKTWTIHPPQQPDDEFAGAGIWSTPTIDREAKVAYAGTANPFKPQAEHKHANAVLKFDINRKSPRFGQIIDSYKGDIDEYIPGLSTLPCFDIPGNPPPYYPQGIGSCGDIDLDFGSSPNLFRDQSGRKLVGVGQKSGVYHVFDAKTMDPVWTQIVGPPGALGGIVGSTAHDGESVYGPITVPGYLWSISAAGGSHRWFGPIADGAHWGPPVAVANGVVYTVDLTGFLDAFDARTGALLAKRPLALGGGGPVSLSWAGVSVARHTVYAAVGITGLPEGHIVALRPGGPNELADDVQRTPGSPGGGGGGGGGGGPAAGGAVIAGPGSTYSTYYTPVMTTSVGGPLSFSNFDLPQHDVVSDERGPGGGPLFSSRLAGIGEIVPVEGLDRVQSGRTYGFYCSIHPGMRGQLIVR